MFSQMKTLPAETRAAVAYLESLSPTTNSLSAKTQDEIALRQAELLLRLYERKSNQSIIHSESRHHNTVYLVYFCTVILCLLPGTFCAMLLYYTWKAPTSSPMDMGNAIGSLAAILSPLIMGLLGIIGTFIYRNTGKANRTGIPGEEEKATGNAPGMLGGIKGMFEGGKDDASDDMPLPTSTRVSETQTRTETTIEADVKA